MNSLGTREHISKAEIYSPAMRSALQDKCAGKSKATIEHSPIISSCDQCSKFEIDLSHGAEIEVQPDANQREIRHPLQRRATSQAGLGT